jgi:hypothetical protein
MAMTARLSLAQGEQLERLNQTLAARDQYLMQTSAGAFVVYRIERGAVCGYDRLVRTRRSFATLAVALQELSRCV